ncbi:hypothetical protein ACJX0J_021201, partial [Zea mays]
KKKLEQIKKTNFGMPMNLFPGQQTKHGDELMIVPTFNLEEALLKIKDDSFRMDYKVAESIYFISFIFNRYNFFMMLKTGDIAFALKPNRKIMKKRWNLLLILLDRVARIIILFLMLLIG